MVLSWYRYTPGGESGTGYRYTLSAGTGMVLSWYRYTPGGGSDTGYRYTLAAGTPL